MLDLRDFDISLDATLVLRTSDGQAGTITLRLSPIAATKVGVINIGNAQEDIKRSGVDRSAAAMDSKYIQSFDAAQSAYLEQGDLFKALGNTVGKLELVVRIVDVAAKVNPIYFLANFF